MFLAVAVLSFVLYRRNYGFPPTANEPIPILFGPGLESQQTVSENGYHATS